MVGIMVFVPQKYGLEGFCQFCGERTEDGKGNVCFDCYAERIR